jgi:hypothetical protein
MPAEFMEKCATCCYFSRNPNPTNPHTGQCRKMSPKADALPNFDGKLTVRTYWPVVHDDWWCGGHRDKG